MVFNDRNKVSTAREKGAIRFAHRRIMSSWSCWDNRFGIWTLGCVLARFFEGALDWFVSRDFAALPAFFEAADCCFVRCLLLLWFSAARLA